MTKKPLNLDSEVIMSSAIPSAKYSCSGSLLMFANGNTAIDGFSGNGNGASDTAGTSLADGSDPRPPTSIL